MKFYDKERVDGTSIFIGRRAQHRTGKGERISKTWTAEYMDADGKRRFEGLGTTIKRDARRKAQELQRSLDEGVPRRRATRLTIEQLIDRYTASNEAKGLAPKTLAKYGAELDKLRVFCKDEGIEQATRFNEEAFYRFGARLREREHKQGTTYAGKTIYTTLTVVKQLFKWAWRQKLITESPIESASLPSGKTRPQPCFTSSQVDAMLVRCHGRPGWGTTRAAIAILAFTGLRVGELVQLRWEDVRLDLGELGMLHVRRGGSGDSPKNKEDRFVPIHPRARPFLDALPREENRVLPQLRDRTLLARIKQLCRELEFGTAYKTHSLRHHFASMCANTAVPYRMALSWMGHTSSNILDLYYHLHDAESEAAMIAVAERGMALAAKQRD